MLAVTLGAMMLGLTALVFQEPAARAQKRSLQELAVVTRHLFREAQNGRTQYWLVFDIGKNTWRVEEPMIDAVAGTVENKPYTNPRNPEIKELNELPESVDIQDVETLLGRETLIEAKVAFRSSGYVDPFVLHLETNEGSRETKSLIVEPLTGFSDIVDGYIQLQARD